MGIFSIVPRAKLFQKNLEESNIQKTGNPFGLKAPSLDRKVGSFEQRLQGLATQTPQQFAAENLQAQQASFADRIAQQQAQQQSGLAEAQASLAARGGFGGGARERLAGISAEQGALQRQGLRGQAEQAKLGTLAEAVDRQRGLQGTLAGQEIQESQFVRGSEQDRFKSQLGALAAMRSSKEQAKAAKSSGGGK